MAALRLYLLRHAKSSWSEDGLADIDRPLAERGRGDAVATGELMVREGYVPALVLCSTARRARETLAGLLPSFDGELSVTLTRQVYEAGPGALLTLIRASGGDVPALLVIGHNPTLEQLARQLVARGTDGAVARMTRKYPTCGLAVIDFEADNWAGIEPDRGHLAAFITPQDGE